MTVVMIRMTKKETYFSKRKVNFSKGKCIFVLRKSSFLRKMPFFRKRIFLLKKKGILLKEEEKAKLNTFLTASSNIIQKQEEITAAGEMFLLNP